MHFQELTTVLTLNSSRAQCIINILEAPYNAQIMMACQNSFYTIE